MERRLHLLAALFVLWLGWGQVVPLELAAQGGTYATLTGTVVHAETGAPLSDVNVFIATSTIGTATDAEGHFRLDGLRPGAHRLVLSSVGYVTETHDVLIREVGLHTLRFTLRPDVIEVGEVTVTASRDRRWRRNLDRFEDHFLGETPNAAHVEILNPEVLSFVYRKGRLIATATAPLIIENRALGYRLHYLLHQFVAEGDQTWQDGASFFEPLTPSGDDEAARWAANRRAAYVGSPRHFLLAMLAGTSVEKGYVTYTVSTPSRQDRAVRGAPRRDRLFAVNPRSFLAQGVTPHAFTFAFDDVLEVVFTREREDRAYRRWQGQAPVGRGDFQRSWIRLTKGPVVLDDQGNVLDPYGIAYYGYMAFERVADLLPKEYRPSSEF